MRIGAIEPAAICIERRAMKSRIMYIESKADGLGGPARIGRVSFSKSGLSIYYRGAMFQRLGGAGFKANYFEVDSGAYYWFSGCKKGGGDRLYSGTIEIDDDVREEYWLTIRKLPERVSEGVIRCTGKY
jgi:hypothetical protein